jgi:hypothetical protein
LTGKSCLSINSSELLFDIGVTHYGESEFQPDYLHPIPSLAPSFVSSPMVMYLRSQRIRITNGQSLGKVVEPYFNRDFQHFCSHQHAPPDFQKSRYDCGVIKNRILYLAHPVFAIYRGLGSVALKDYIINCLNLVLNGSKSIDTNLPSTARISMMKQSAMNRRVVHLLHANTINRGGEMKFNGGTISASSRSIEVIEDILPLRNAELSIRLPQPVTRVTLEPQGVPVQFTRKEDQIHVKIDEFSCHQMIVLQH